MASVLDELFMAFKDESNNVDLVQILSYIDGADNRLQNSSQLIITKLKQVTEGRASHKVNYNKLSELLDMNIKTKDNFDLVFESLSGDDWITYDQLQRLNNQLSLGFTRQQMEGMIGCINTKTDRISKSDLYNYLKSR